MIPKSIRSLITKLQQEGLEIIVGGGLAVNAHGFARLTTDADLIVRKDDREKALVVLSNLGFVEKGTTNVSTRLSHSSYLVPFVDLLWTEAVTFQIFLEGAVSIYPSCKTISLPHLIAMKIHAIAQNAERFAKDSEDIRWLLKYNPTQISLQDYQNLLDRFASDGRKEYLLALHPDN